MRYSLLLLFAVLASALAKAQAPADSTLTELLPLFTSPRCATLTDYAQKKSCADQALLEFIYSELTYPKKARRWKVQGTAVVKFVIERDGSMSSLELVRDPGMGIGEEGLRLVHLLAEQPPWSPGLQNGKPVRVLFNLPIQFSLN